MADTQKYLDDLKEKLAILQSTDGNGDHQFTGREIANAMLNKVAKEQPQDFARFAGYIEQAHQLYQEVENLPATPTTPREKFVAEVVAPIVGRGNQAGTGENPPADLLAKRLEQYKVAASPEETKALAAELAEGIKYANWLDRMAEKGTGDLQGALGRMGTELRTLEQNNKRAATEEARLQRDMGAIDTTQTRGRTMIGSQAETVATRDYTAAYAGAPVPAEAVQDAIAQKAAQASEAALATFNATTGPAFDRQRAALRVKIAENAKLKLTPEQEKQVGEIRGHMEAYNNHMADMKAPTVADFKEAAQANAPDVRGR